LKANLSEHFAERRFMANIADILEMIPTAEELIEGNHHFVKHDIYMGFR
jgi:hypothetical protein